MMRLSIRRTFSPLALLALSARTSQAFAPLGPLPVRACLSFHTRSTSTALGASTTPIVDQVMEQMKLSMKAKDTVRLNTIRLIRAAFANAAIEAKTEKLSDDQCVVVMRKMAKLCLAHHVPSYALHTLTS
jgi:hypothetical protein